MPALTDPAANRRLEAYLYVHIPLVRGMQLRVEEWNAEGLSLSAPLAPNLNHEGTAFGGSLEGLATLACWGLLWLVLEHEPDTHIVVAEAHMQFARPVSGALRAHCPMPQPPLLKAFLDTLHQRHKARIELHCEIVEHQNVCATFDGRFAAHRAGAHAG